MTLRRRAFTYVAAAAIAVVRADRRRLDRGRAPQDLLAADERARAPGRCRRHRRRRPRRARRRPARVRRRPAAARGGLARAPPRRPRGDLRRAATPRARSLRSAARCCTPLGSRRPAGSCSIRSARLAFAEWRPFLWGLLLAGLGGALLAAISSYLLARRLTRPIERVGGRHRPARGRRGRRRGPRCEGEDELAGLAGSFNQMSAELARAREAQRSFLESVSHELKTPLTSIRGYAEAVSDGAIAPGRGQPGDRLRGRPARAARRRTCSSSPASGEPSSPSPASRSTSRQIAARAVERHQPRAHELSARADGHRLPSRGRHSATRAACCRPRRT